MGLFKNIARLFHSSKQQPSQPPSVPSALMQQQQQIQAALQRLEAERNRQINLLKQEACRLLELTRSNYDKVTEYSILSTLESNSQFKEKEEQFQSSTKNLREIKIILEAIAEGDCSRLHELKNNLVFNKIFPKFNYNLCAAQAGLSEYFRKASKEQVKRTEEIKENKETKETIERRVSSEKHKETEFRGTTELKEVKENKESKEEMENSPKFVFKAQIDRPLLERVAGVYAYHTMEHLVDGAIYKQEILKNSDFQYLKTLVNNEHSGVFFKESPFFAAVDSVSRLAQVVVDQSIENDVLYPNIHTKEITRAFALAAITVEWILKHNKVPMRVGYELKLTEQQIKQKVKLSYPEYYNAISTILVKICVFAGMVRRISEKENHGENIGQMMLDTRKLLEIPNNRGIWLINDPVSSALTLSRCPFETRNERAEILIYEQYLKSEDKEWILELSHLLAAYEKIMKSGCYPIGDPRILVAAKTDLISQTKTTDFNYEHIKSKISIGEIKEKDESRERKSTSEGKFSAKTESFNEVIGNNVKTFKPGRPLIERVAGLKSFCIQRWLPADRTQTLNMINSSSRGLLMLRDPNGNDDSTIDNISRAAQNVINQYFAQGKSDNDHKEIAKSLALATITIRALKHHYKDMLLNRPDIFIPLISRAFVFSGMVRRMAEKGDCKKKIEEIILEAFDKCHELNMSGVKKLILSTYYLHDKEKLVEIWQNEKTIVFDLEWVSESAHFLSLYEKITLSGCYPIGDPRILKDAQLGKLSEELLELERRETNLNPVFKQLNNRPFIEKLASVVAFQFFIFERHTIDTLKGKELYSLQISQRIKHCSNKKFSDSHYFTIVDNLSRIVQKNIGQCLNNSDSYRNYNPKKMTMAFSLGLVTLIQALRRNQPDYNPDESLDRIEFVELRGSIFSYLPIRDSLFSSLVRIICEKGNHGENIKNMIFEAYDNFYSPIMPHAEKLLELSSVPLEKRKAVFEKWQTEGPVHFDLETAQLVATYKEVMLSGQYALDDPRILIEAQELEARRKAKSIAKEQEKVRPLAVRTAGAALLHCALKGLPAQNDFSKLASEYQHLISTFNVENNHIAIESDHLSRIAEDVIEQVMSDDRSKNHPRILIKALSLASMAVLHAASPELSEEETDKMIKAALFAGMARKLYVMKNPENDAGRIRNFLEALHELQSSIAPHLLQVESLIKLSQAAYGERLKLLKELQTKSLAEFELEWADLTDAYIKITQTRQFPIGDARILVEAEILRQNIEEEQPFRSPLLESPFEEELPSLTENWRTHEIQFKERNTWDIRIVTPEVLTFEAQQGQMMLHHHRSYLIELIRSKLTTPIFSEPLRYLETPQRQTPLLLESPQTAPIAALSSASAHRNIIFNFPKTEGLYFIECKQTGENAKLYRKAVFVQKSSFLTTALPDSYICGKPQTITFKASLTGQFTLQQGSDIRSKTFNLASHIEFTLTKPGMVKLSIQLKDYPDCIESQTATVYHPQEEARLNFRVKEAKEGLSFFLGNKNIADLNFQGQIDLWEKSIPPKTDNLLNTQFREHFSKAQTIFEHCSHKEQLVKTMMICQRLLPHSLMFAPFLSVASCFTQTEECIELEPFITLLCQQIALCELMQKNNLEKISQFIEAHQKSYPAHWSTFFNLTHQASEQRALKGLFLQTLTMHFIFLKSDVKQLSVEPLFKLTRYLFALRSPTHSEALNDDLSLYFQKENNYEIWLSEVNAVLGADRNSLQKHQKIVADLLAKDKEKFGLAQTKQGDIQSLRQSVYLQQGVQTGQYCLQGIEQLKEHHRAIEAGCAQDRAALNNALVQVNQNISQYYALAYQSEQDTRAAQKHARHKRRACIVRNVIGLAVGAFLAPIIAPVLIKGSGLALAATKGAIAGGISSGIGGRNILKGTLQGAAFAGFGFQATEWIKPFEFAPIVSESIVAGATSLASTAVHGGKVIPNLLVGVGTSTLAHLCIEGPTLESSPPQSFIMEARNMLARTAITAGVTTLCHRTELGENLISASLGIVQSIAGNQGEVAAQSIEKRNQVLSKSTNASASLKPAYSKTPQAKTTKPQGPTTAAQKEKPKKSSRIASARKEAEHLRQEPSSRNILTNTSSPSVARGSAGMEQFLRENQSAQSSFATTFQSSQKTRQGMSGFFIRSAQAGTPHRPTSFSQQSRTNRMSYKDVAVSRQIDATVAQQMKNGLRIPAAQKDNPQKVSKGFIQTSKIYPPGTPSNKRTVQFVFAGADQRWLTQDTSPSKALSSPLAKQAESSFLKSSKINSSDVLATGKGAVKGAAVGTGLAGAGYVISKNVFGRFLLKGMGTATVALVAGEILEQVADFETAYFSCSEEYREVLQSKALSHAQKIQFTQKVHTKEMEARTKLTERFNLKHHYKENPEGFGFALGATLVPAGVLGLSQKLLHINGRTIKTHDFALPKSQKGLLPEYPICDDLVHRSQQLAGAWRGVSTPGVMEIAPSGKLRPLTQFSVTIAKQKDSNKHLINFKMQPPGLAHNANAQIAISKKMSALENAQKKAVRTIELGDGRTRYYEVEKLAKKEGLTRGASYVTEYNQKTRQVRSWYECYDQHGKVNRIHNKMIDGQDIVGQHYPPTQMDFIKFFIKKEI